ncbi:class I SAM-dependent methyltransferase [Candidatus Njordibacter sp. Uisw_056]|jgi:2-polyprenyl-3-methyl-5-hydroxy-6-metoxy-1,4-benzoquinol methylase|uniref:class I SAM-dependent methyltransferase n=1 Tax=Candidatus Njordibacter sp. Uisw_056 TaxID=3230973 RepID=UPI003D404861
MKNKYQSKKSSGGWIMADPLPSDDELKQFYEEKYYQLDDDVATKTYQDSYSKRELQHKTFEAELCFFAVKNNFQGDILDISVLEIGVGEGFLLKELSKNVKDYKGVDFSKYSIAQFFPELLSHFEQADVYEYLRELDKKYDVIILRNTIEHVREPMELMKALKESINPNGLVAFSFPNDYSVIQELSKKMGYTKKEEFWFCPPEHLSYFNTETGKKFAEKCGLNIVDMFSIFPIDVFLLTPASNYIERPEVGKFAHKARMELELTLWQKEKTSTLDLFRQFANNGIGREITIIAQFNENT